MINRQYMKNHNVPSYPISCPHNIHQKDPGWKDRMVNQWWLSANIEDPDKLAQMSKDTPEMQNMFMRLHEILLRCGGVETCFTYFEPDLKSIIERGRFYKGTSFLLEGTPGCCHSNVATVWRENCAFRDLHITTGYALSEDGLWRQHSWLVHRYKTEKQHRTRIIETTTKRKAYFGFELTTEEAIVFCGLNP